MLFLSYAQAKSEPLLTEEEEVNCVIAWQEDKDENAREKLVRSHARIAYKMARGYSNNEEHIKDLAVAGMMGLMKACDKYDLSHGTRFATYCKWWVLTGISEVVGTVSTVVDMPSRTYIDAKMGRLDGDIGEKANMAIYGVSDLNAPVSADADISGLDLLESHKPSPEQEAVRNQAEASYKRTIAGALESLTDNERHVITRRRLSMPPASFEEVAKELGVTRERIRQIEGKALQKMKRAIMADDGPFQRADLRDEN